MAYHFFGWDPVEHFAINKGYAVTFIDTHNSGLANMMTLDRSIQKYHGVVLYDSKGARVHLFWL